MSARGTAPPGTSRHVAAIEVSAIKQMAMLSARVDGAASLAWGLPSFRTPAHVREAVKAALDSDHDLGKYALPDGLPELRRLAASRHEAATGIPVDPDREVLVTAGNMQGLNALLHALLDPGDEVILTDPGFASHVQQIRLCGGLPVFWAYVFPRILVEHEDSTAFSLRLLEEARVTVTPGSAFGPHGEHHVRMAFCVDEATMETAFDRIEHQYRA